MRDRLIELLLNAPQIPCVKGGQATGKRYQTFQNIADHLLANGVIVPPCKVGDTVYVLVSGTDTILQTKVFAIGVDECGNTAINPKDYPEGVFGVIGYEFGKTIFLTKEEAERALKEREQG